jgi:hypothetical protein
VLAMGAHDRLQNPTEVSLGTEPSTSREPEVHAGRRYGARACHPAKAGPLAMTPLFSHPLRNYGKGSFRVEKDREILHWVSGFGINSFRKEDLL